MIAIDACNPSRGVLNRLAAWQGEVDAHRKPYAKHIDTADEAFARRRRAVDFASVSELLRALCSGVRRCMYCQDSGGVDVEHYRPKAWYPELVFAWANFLLICTRCNRKKSSRFPLFHPKAPAVRVLTRAKGTAPRRPPAADPVLLNPRFDDPSRYLTLDLLGTFHFVERGAKGTAPWLRAHHTIETLELNDDDLPRARRNAYDSFLSHLRLAAGARQAANAAEERRIRGAVGASPCSVVWREMLAQQANIPELRDAFVAFPDALRW